MLTPVPIAVASPARNASCGSCVATATAKIGASVDKEPSMSPVVAGCARWSRNDRWSRSPRVPPGRWADGASSLSGSFPLTNGGSLRIVLTEGPSEYFGGGLHLARSLAVTTMNLASLVSPSSDHLDGAVTREAVGAGAHPTIDARYVIFAVGIAPTPEVVLPHAPYQRPREIKAAYDPDQAVISARPVRPARS